MNAMPPTCTDPAPGTRAPPLSGAHGLSLAWAALQEAGAVVCALAGEEPEQSLAEVRNFPALVRDAVSWRRELAEKGVDDLAAMMRPGIAALLAVNARGIDAGHAARALWNEFLAARSALLALVPPSEALGRRRSA